MQPVLRPRSSVAPRTLGNAPAWALFGVNGLALVCVLVLLFSAQPVTPLMRVGQVSPETVVAQKQVTFVDRVATAARRKLAMAAAPPRYRTDTTFARARQLEASAFLRAAGPVLAATEPEPQKISSIRKLVPPGVSPAALQTFPSLTATDFQVVQKHSLALLTQAESWPFDINQATSTEFSLLSTLPAGVDLKQRTAIGEILSTFLAPTLILDASATRVAQQAAAAAVPEVVSTVKQGEVVVRRGDIVTPTVLEELNALGLQSNEGGWQDTLASILFSVLVIGVLFWYLHAFHASVILNTRLLLLVDLSILATVAGARVLATGHILLPYFLPAAAATTFTAALMAPEAAISIGLGMALLAGWIVAGSFELTLYYFLSSAAGVLAIYRMRNIKQFILAGVTIMVFAFLTLVTFGLVDRTYDLAAVQEYALAAVFNGFVSSTLALGGFTLLSSLFGVTTTLQLLELAQPNQALLRRLAQRASGTYNHSLLVSTMVERAADEIGANALIARVGALYHDVGKVVNPHCFAENQMGIGNVHDDLHPEESARIIRGHVSQGLKLGRQYRLPRVVLDAIAEHHGTMPIAYFLHRAIASAGADNVDVSLYRYPGPKPGSKETALIMLADGCESTVRAAQDHSAGIISETIERIFDERLKTGQLDGCPLTIQDLERARQAFGSILNGLYHPRVEYPEPIDLATRPSPMPEVLEAP